jgi:TRAP-type C4-dicarboxylate transport system permease large subunit
LPFVLLMFLAMVLISVFPEIALWLPSKMMN